MERPPGIQQIQLHVSGTDLRGIASRVQALEAMKQSERENDRAKRARLDEQNKILSKNLSNAENNRQGQKSEQ